MQGCTITPQKYIKLEGHSVEHMYLRQSCFDGSLAQWNHVKTTPRCSGKTYTSDFLNVKFRVAALTRYRRKQSSSGIRTNSKVDPLVRVPTSVDMQHFIQIDARVFEYRLILLTDIQTPANAFTSTFVGGKETRGQSNLTKSASRGAHAHSPVRGHPRGVEICTIEFLG